MTFLLWEFPRLPPVLHMPFMVIGLIIAVSGFVALVQFINDKYP